SYYVRGLGYQLLRVRPGDPMLTVLGVDEGCREPFGYKFFRHGDDLFFVDDADLCQHCSVGQVWVDMPDDADACETGAVIHDRECHLYTSLAEILGLPDVPTRVRDALDLTAFI
ncbi:hypothetical protein, partial [Bacillus safensis]|uniref:hypothetical protein n=1 Tax=Bacillus safensis TaxID=561879 RepID=UPI00365B36ED